MNIETSNNLSGLTVFSLEGNMTPFINKEIKKHGGTVLANGSPHQIILSIITGKIDLLLFTHAPQVDELLQEAQKSGKEASFRRALHRICIGSSDSGVSQNLARHQFFADFEALAHKPQTLADIAAQKGRAIVDKKRIRADKAWVTLKFNETLTQREYDDTLNNSLVMKACRLEENQSVPIWLMRQAGRYMAEYQMIRKKVNFMEFCKNPDLASQATISAAERLGVDAAIIFSDILLILEPMGFKLEYLEGKGPVINNPFRDIKTIQKLKKVDVKESLPFLFEAITKTRRAMHPRIPLIGFCGAPFTLCSYMIEGGGSRNYKRTKQFMHDYPEDWHVLMEIVSTTHIDYLNAQIDAGCQLVQIFDSWVGSLTPDDYTNLVLPHTKKLISGVKKGVPVLHFGSFTAPMIPDVATAGGHVISVDWRMNIKEVAKQMPDKCIQGNLDPVLLFSKPKAFLQETEKILKAVGRRPGFIFNLGHGILPKTPVDHVMALVDFVHEYNLS